MSRRIARQAGLAAASAAAVSILLLSACRREALPDILLISLDTLRSDCVWPREGEVEDMPWLAEFARGAIQFRAAQAPIAFTLPSHMTLFTGLHPQSHGVDVSRVLADAVAPMGERLKAKGYATLGLHTNEWMKGDFGFARGFDRYEQLPHAPTYADRVVEAALAGWPAAKEGAPRFVFLHFMDAHSDFLGVQGSPLPYFSPAEFRSDLQGAGEASEFCLPSGGCATDYLLSGQIDASGLDESRVRLAETLYRRGARYLDSELQKLFTQLAARGLLERTLVIVTSDHGEEFREHGRMLHSQVYEESLRVPLIVKLPGESSPAGIVDTPVGLEDLLPTVLDLIGAPSAGESLDGRSLVPLLRDAADAAVRPLLSQDKLTRSVFGLRQGNWKLVSDLHSGDRKLFDLRADPGELHNLASGAPTVLDELSSALRATLARSRAVARKVGAQRAPWEEVLTREEVERLRSLGYID